MSGEPSQPDWSLLPDDPVRFFALAEGFDRTALKRAYNALVRRFKPEHHPAEFQQIRAAYEQLDQMLSYPEQFAGFMRVRPAPPDEAEAESGPTARISPRVQQKSLREKLIERLATESPETIYQELRNDDSSSPERYFALALLADVVERDKPLRFIEWLLAGLKKFPRADSLKWLLFEALRSPLPASAAEKILLACAETLSQGEFYAITESLWEGLLRDDRAPVVEKLLTQCEQKLKGLALDCRATFMLRMARIALWLPDPAWGLSALEFAEAHFHELPDYLTNELDLLSFVREYIKRRPEFRTGDEVRGAIDSAMASFFSGEEQLADAQVVAANVRIATDPTATAAAFPRRDDGAWDHGVRLWLLTSVEVGQRVGIGLGQAFDQELWYSRVAALIDQLDRQFWKSRRGLNYRIQRLLLTGLRILMVFVPISLGINIIDPDVPYLDFGIVGLPIGGVVVVGGFLFAYWYGQRISRTKWDPYFSDYFRSTYNCMWRREIWSFTQRARVSCDFVSQCIAHRFEQSQPKATYSWMAEGVANDRGLEVFALAQHFLR